MGGKKVCVILDSNIWIQQTWLLKSSLGAAFLYYAQQKKVKIGLPEVVELEIIKHAKKTGIEAIEKINQGFSIIEKSFGKRDFFNVPTLEEFERVAKLRLSELDDKIVRIPFDFSQAKGALKRIMDETPPNKSGNQQFKDSIIWEALLKMIDEYDVYFVTEDKMFFEDRNPHKGLVKNLGKEVKTKKGRVKIYYGLGVFLEEVKETTPQLDKGRIAHTVDESIHDTLIKDTKGASIGKMTGYRIDAFLTDHPTELAIKFCLEHEITYFSENSEEKYEGSLAVEGECLLDLDKFLIGNTKLDTLTISTPEGCPVPSGRCIYASCTIGGYRTVKFKLREPLWDN